jgi:ATP-dependent Lhr-like helicase
VLVKEGKLVLFTFTGTRINRSLVFLLNCLDVPVSYTYQEEDSSFTLALTPAQLPALVEQLRLFA